MSSNLRLGYLASKRLRGGPQAPRLHILTDPSTTLCGQPGEPAVIAPLTRVKCETCRRLHKAAS